MIEPDYGAAHSAARHIQETEKEREMSIELENLEPGNLEHCHEVIRQIARQCNLWAEESRNGGWSTHQVSPNRDAAMKLYAFLDRMPDSISGNE